jgi:hypothetical protein
VTPTDHEDERLRKPVVERWDHDVAVQHRVDRECDVMSLADLGCALRQLHRHGHRDTSRQRASRGDVDEMAVCIPRRGCFADVHCLAARVDKGPECKPRQ